MMLQKLLSRTVRAFLVFVCISIFISSSANANEKIVAEEALKHVFKNVSIDSLVFNDSLNMYEITIEGNVFYVTKDLKYAILGHIFDIQNPSHPVNLTAKKQEDITKKMIEKINKDNAFKVGKGDIEVIEISSPRCPHCRKLAQYMKNQEDKVTRYIFFAGVENDPLISYILCQPEDKKYKAYEEVYSGKVSPQNVKSCGAVEKNFEEVSKLKIHGVPVLFIKNQVIHGANIELIDSIIKSTVKKEGK